jgi:hypothetical protein
VSNHQPRHLLTLIQQIYQIPNAYDIVYHGKRYGLVIRQPDRITFTDHSSLYALPSSPPRKKQRSTRSGNAGSEMQRDQVGIPLPNPCFFRIHPAIAGVLHMSGAGGGLDAAVRGAVLGHPEPFKSEMTLNIYFCAGIWAGCLGRNWRSSSHSAIPNIDVAC